MCLSDRNLYIKKFIDQLVSKSLLKESDITCEFRDASYPVGAISTLQGVESVCFSPDCYDSADEIVEAFYPIADGRMKIELLGEGEGDDGEYEVLLRINGDNVLIKERIYPLAYYSAVNEIISIFNEVCDFKVVVESFSGEEVFCVLVGKDLADFINKYQDNVNYDELHTEV